MSIIKHLDFKILLFVTTIFLGFSFIFPVDQANAQRRDHLTAEEVEVVRDVQEIDYRMLVFIKAIERRFMALGGADKLTKDQIKLNEKDLDVWGELPKGTQTELLSDIDKILEESISKIDDVADRDVENDLLPIAIYLLADRAKLFIPRLEAFSENNKSNREIAVLNSSIRNCKEIIEASTKLERPREKEMKKRLNKLKS